MFRVSLLTRGAARQCCRFSSTIARDKDADAFRSFMNHREGSVLTEDLESYNQDWTVGI